jgi:hypothetical protein
MPEIVCPECGTRVDLPAVRRSSEEFCSHCDYPLFWAPTAVPSTTPGSSSEMAMRRLPGAGGRLRVGSKVCPACGELNPLGESNCLRCRSDLDPKPVEPVPEPVPEPPPPVRPEPVVVTEPERAIEWWWWVVLAVATAVLVVAIVATS